MKEEKYEQIGMGFEKEQLHTQIEVTEQINKLDLKDALLRRAVGYVCKERADEYAVDILTGNLRLIRRKITHKEVPPDVAAAKMLVDVFNQNAIRSMSDEELECEKMRLFELLKQQELQKEEKPMQKDIEGECEEESDGKCENGGVEQQIEDTDDISEYLKEKYQRGGNEDVY